MQQSIGGVIRVAVAVGGLGLLGACGESVPIPVAPHGAESASSAMIPSGAENDLGLTMREGLRGRSDAEFTTAFEKGRRVVTIGFKPVLSPWGVDNRGRALVSDLEKAQHVTYVASRATRVLHRFTTIPAITVELPSAQVANAIRRLPWVDYVAEATQLLTPDALSVDCFPYPPPRGYADPTETVPWNISRVRADQAWSIATGMTGYDRDLAVLDDGADEQQANSPLGPELGSPRVYAWYVSPSANDGFHGTSVLGAAVAGRNGVGTVGVAPDAQTRVLKITDVNYPNFDYYATFAIDANAWYSRVMSISYSTKQTSSSPPPSMAPMYDAIRTAYWAYRVVFVASTGNQGRSDWYAYPAAFPEVVGVGGSGYADEYVSNNYAPGNVDIAAPAVDVGTVCKGGQTGTADGTSFSTPMVAGAFMLLRQQFPYEPVDDLRARLMRTAVPMANTRQSGAGRMDVYAALTQ